MTTVRNRMALAISALLALGAVATVAMTVYLTRVMVGNMPDANVGDVVLGLVPPTLAGLVPYGLMAVTHRRLGGGILPDTVLLIGAVGLVVFAAWAYFPMYGGTPGHGSYSFYLVPVFQCIAVAVIAAIAWAARQIEGAG
ncbi:MAG: hypothetical protein JSW43_06845 [Gemmatimonadota bacterium]|nr:MAG: hypothetical protein JSW43_06845 [Gemmatimonadota bacterium]